MEWIGALLAFATTMLFFAIVVSMLVEMIHRTVGLREAGLRRMLERYFDRVIQKNDKTKLSIDAKTFVDTITENRVFGGSGPTGLVGGLHWLIGASKLTHLPVEMFMERLLDKNKFSELQNIDPHDQVLKDLAQKYVTFGSEMSTYFERRARLFSVLVSFLVAWIFYVHPYDLAVAYLKNPEIAQDVSKISQEMLDRLEEMKAANSTTGADGADGTLPSPGGTTGNQENADGQSGQQTEKSDPQNVDDCSGKELDCIKKTLEEIKSGVTDLQNIGVPIGWPDPTSIAMCGADESEAKAETSRMAADDKDASQFCLVTENFLWLKVPVIWPSFKGVIWLIIGGLLVGLGAPFCAKMVSGLMTSQKEVAKMAEIVGGQPTTSTAQVPQTAPRQAESTAVEAFKVAQGAQN
jgi:hypothetical protein